MCVMSKLEMLDGPVIYSHRFLKLWGIKLGLEQALKTIKQSISIQSFRQPWQIAISIAFKAVVNFAKIVKPELSFFCVS